MEQAIAVARCHEIQISIGAKEIPRFEAVTVIGMAVQLALHIRGLPLIEYERLKLVASTMLNIPRVSVERIVRLLADIEFVRLHQEGSRIKGVMPAVPYFDALYSGLGEYMQEESCPDEFEQLSLEVVDRLAKAPHNVDSLAGKLGADRKSFDQSLSIGVDGGFLYKKRARGKDVVLNPTYFSENANVFADHVAACGAQGVERTLRLISAAQGWPLSLIEQTGEINGVKIPADDILLLKRLAGDGAVRPPMIKTSHAGETFFMFTPVLGGAGVSPMMREVHEKAYAIVSAIRQGQLLPNKYAIRSPAAVLYKLKTELCLSPTSDYHEQYGRLVSCRIAVLEDRGSGYRQLKVIDTPENREALNIAYGLVQGAPVGSNLVDGDACKAMTGSEEYVESLVSSRLLRDREKIVLSEEASFQYEQLILNGI